MLGKKKYSQAEFDAAVAGAAAKSEAKTVADMLDHHIGQENEDRRQEVIAKARAAVHNVPPHIFMSACFFGGGMFDRPESPQEVRQVAFQAGMVKALLDIIDEAYANSQPDVERAKL